MNPIKTTFADTFPCSQPPSARKPLNCRNLPFYNTPGSYGIPATMTFTRSGNQYKIVSTIKVPLYNIRFESGGSINGTTLHPSYSQRWPRGGKLYAEAKFSGGNITYGKTGDLKTEKSGPAMDLFTLAWQLAVNDVRLPSGLKNYQR